MEFLWTPWQTLGLGVEILVVIMFIVIFLSLFPPYQFKGFKDYFLYLVGWVFGIIGTELFVLILVLTLGAIDNFFSKR